MFRHNLGIGFNARYRSAISEGVFNPASLFALGEAGAWYEPSPTTAFASTTDLTPCGVGDTCGFLLDLSNGAGYSGGSFTGLGSELVTNGTFDIDTSGWTAINSILSVVSGALRVADDGAWSQAYQSFSTTVGAMYLVSVDCVATADDFRVGIKSTLPADGSYGTEPLGIVPTAGTKQFVFVADATTTYIILGSETSDSADYDNVSVKELPGNHAFQATAASRPTLRQTGGGLYYLEFDGTDDSMATSAIDFTGTDKMSVFIGLEKTESSVEIVLELSATVSTNDGTFYAAVNDASGSVEDFSAASRGDAAADPTLRAATDDAQNQKVVYTALHDISGDSSILRIDGTQIDEATGDKGAGNFGDYPLYLGARNGASLQFEGMIFCLGVRGAATSGSDLANAESRVAGLTGVTI